jgi:hypothetical protein
MKKVLLSLVIIAVVAGFFVHYNNNPEAIVSALVKKGKIGSGDLVYRIYFLGLIPVGEAVIKKDIAQDYNGQGVYHLSAIARSAKYFSRIFSATAEVDSYIDRQTLNPVFFLQKTMMSGKGESKKGISYDQVNNIMTIANTRRQILPNTQDPLSAVYNLRRMDFGKAREFKININTNQKNYVMAGTAAIREAKIKAETVRLTMLEAEIRRSDGNPHHKSRLSVVLLEGKENIPVLIRVFASGAIISAKLIDIE